MIAYSEHSGPKQATDEDKTRLLNQSCVPVTIQKEVIAVSLLVPIRRV